MLETLKLEGKNKVHAPEIDNMPELDNLDGISSSLFGNYELSEDLGNVTNSYFTILLII
jgi:hypothetical protein